MSGIRPVVDAGAPVSRAFTLRLADERVAPDASAPLRVHSARHPRPPPPSTERLRKMDLHDVIATERDALRRRVSAQRHLSQERRREAVRHTNEDKRAMATETRKYLDKGAFRDLKTRLLAKHGEDGIATDEEVKDLSRRFNKRMKYLFVDPYYQRWFSLFKYMDIDESGLVSYFEFVRMVRDHLRLSTADLPVGKLQRIWLALDTDGSGQISAGEFGVFMRNGAPPTARDADGNFLDPNASPAQALVQAAQARRARLQRSRDEDRAGVHLATVERAKASLLPDYRRAARSHDEQATRMGQELQRLRGRPTTPRTGAGEPNRPQTVSASSARGVQPGALPDAGGDGARSAPGAARGAPSSSRALPTITSPR